MRHRMRLADAGRFVERRAIAEIRAREKRLAAGHTIAIRTRCAIECSSVASGRQRKSFCAGANFGDGSTLDKSGQRPGEASSPVSHLLYAGGAAVSFEKADHRWRSTARRRRWIRPRDGRISLTCPEARFVAISRARLFHPGFGLTESCRGVGRPTHQMFIPAAAWRRGSLSDGSCQLLVPKTRCAARRRSSPQIAENAPLAILATRAIGAAGTGGPRQSRDRA